jgi:peptidoglycan/xylan/chitin deacetylase (PgdA/CDA1 family)
MRAFKTISILVLAMSAGSCGGKSGGGDDDGNNGGKDAPTGGVDSGATIDCSKGFGAWTGHDNAPPSMMPPCGLAPDKVPQFVGIGWDDNGDAGGVTWALGVHKQTGTHATFFVNSVYGSSDPVKQTWMTALADGNEVGNHTVSHLPNHGGHTYTVEQWTSEISGCTDFLTKTGNVMKADQLFGFRTPYLEYDDETLTTVQNLGFYYDCSIEEGYEEGQDGTNFYWPYTLDNKSPGHTVQVEWMDPENPIKEITPHPGLWEMPVYALIAPPDDKCAQYGAPAGFRKLLVSRQSWFDPASGSITGFDYNLWASVADGGFAMTKAEFLATLKYTFDQHYSGNRAPFLMGAHTAYYMDAWSANAPGTPNAADRRAAIEEFLAYVKDKAGVRITSHKEILDWLRNPKPL